MIEIIALIIFVISFGAIIWILARKIPVLVQMPEVREGIQKENVISILRKKIKKASPDKIILLKILSKVRVFVLKIEKHVDGWLQKTRKKVHSQKQEKEIQKSVNIPTEEKEKKEEQNPPTIPPTMPV